MAASHHRSMIDPVFAAKGLWAMVKRGPAVLVDPVIRARRMQDVGGPYYKGRASAAYIVYWGSMFLGVPEGRAVQSVEASALRAETAPALKGVGDSFSAYVTEDGGGIYAEMGNDQMLDYVIQKKEGLTPRGGEMFEEMMAAYGKNVKGIRGLWKGEGEMRSNFDGFKAGIAKGLSPEQAAATSTFTGVMATRAGFTKVRVIENGELRVIVEFTRE